MYRITYYVCFSLIKQIFMLKGYTSSLNLCIFKVTYLIKIDEEYQLMSPIIVHKMLYYHKTIMLSLVWHQSIIYTLGASIFYITTSNLIKPRAHKCGSYQFQWKWNHDPCNLQYCLFSILYCEWLILSIKTSVYILVCNYLVMIYLFVNMCDSYIGKSFLE